MVVPATNYAEKKTNEGSELRRIYDEAHFQKYLMVMKESNEKVRFFTPLSPTH